MAMTPPPEERTLILVVDDRELYTVLFRSFSSEHFEVLFAKGPAYALALGSMRTLHLVTLPVDREAMLELAGALKKVSIDVAILGTTESQHGNLRTPPKYVDLVMDRSDPVELVSRARSLLGERRNQPRVTVDFPVKLRDRGVAVVRDLSATALLMETKSPLERGERVHVEMEVGNPPFQFEAEVIRVQRTALGKSSLVLKIPEEAHQARQHLERLVWKLLEVQYYFNGSWSEPGASRGPASWEMVRESGEFLEPTGPSVPTDRIENHYRIDRHMGRWGVGEVYLARHRFLMRPVVIKILRQGLKGLESARRRMACEAVVPTNVSCPGIVDILDFGSDGDGGLYYTMEVLKGETLASSMEQGHCYNARDIARLGMHLAAALTLAHLRGYGHCDLCPQNVFLQKWSVGTAWPLLINMGGPPPDGSEMVATHPMGEDYWPPEDPQEGSGPKRDLYALGALLEQLCQIAATGDDIEGLDILREGIMPATAVDPGDRFPDMNVMAHALVQCWETLEAAAPAGDHPRIESPDELKKVFEQSTSAARSYSSKTIVEAIAAFTSEDPGPNKGDAEEEPDGPEAEARQAALEDAAPRSRRGSIRGGQAARSQAASGRRILLLLLLLASVALLAGGGLRWYEASRQLTPAALQASPAAAPAAETTRPPAPPAPAAAPSEPAEVGTGTARTSQETPPTTTPADAAVAPDTSPPPSAVAATKPSRGEPDARTASVTEPRIDPEVVRRSNKRKRKAAMRAAKKLIAAEKYEQARPLLVTALELRDGTRARVLLAQTLEKTGKPHEALKHIQKAATTNLDVAWYQDKIGTLYIKLGKTELACKAFRRALQILPKYGRAKTHLRKYCNN